NCLSTNCTFNSSGACTCSMVNIEGFDACITPETYCKSFIESNTSFNNSAANYNIIEQSILCSANNCMFNFGGSCKSATIQINHFNNTCETFKKRSSNYEY
ncbi:MAG: DUF1540 domain-containing protein, partial [Paraclostridium sp.]